MQCLTIILILMALSNEKARLVTIIAFVVWLLSKLGGA